MVAGSNLNWNAQIRTYMTEYQAEYINPPSSDACLTYGPCICDARCTYGHAYGQARWSISVNRKTITITSVSNVAIHPPVLPGFMYVVMDGIPSVSQRVLIGNGDSPLVDQSPIDNFIANTWGP
ncbi:hypothetical protein OPQ81_001275 [Rhizoctonia solani]|nr:hypothetical protein OPQ81_001275 [Rhizoctonia solani]